MGKKYQIKHAKSIIKIEVTTLVIDGESLTLEDLTKVVWEKERVELSLKSKEKVETSRKYVEKLFKIMMSYTCNYWLWKVLQCKYFISRYPRFTGKFN